MHIPKHLINCKHERNRVESVLAALDSRRFYKVEQCLKSADQEIDIEHYQIAIYRIQQKICPLIDMNNINYD